MKGINFKPPTGKILPRIGPLYKKIMWSISMFSKILTFTFDVMTSYSYPFMDPPRIVADMTIIIRL